MTKISAGRFREVAEQALIQAGASAAAARSLVDATLAAERAGRGEVGIAHLPDYLDNLREGRIAGDAQPQFAYPLPAFIRSDAGGGIAQLGFDLAFGELTERARTLGIAVFTQRNSYTAGELGTYVRRLAGEGLVSIAVANAHAMMATAPGGQPAFSTNPLAFGAPLPPPQSPLVIDQASSATAFVNLARAAAEGRPIPEGWAIDRTGAVTTDASEALLGALLPFGGYKGANIALMVELLSAGLAGANPSLDAGHFRSGNRPPGIGLTVIVLKPDDAFPDRAAALCRRLRELGVHIPGSRALPGQFADADFIEVAPAVLERLAL